MADPRPEGVLEGWAADSHAVGTLRLVAEMARSRIGRRTGIPYTTELDVPAPAAFGDDFRRVMSAFPSGVSVVTARDENGLPRGLTCSEPTSDPRTDNGTTISSPVGVPTAAVGAASPVRMTATYGARSACATDSTAS